MAIDFDKLAHLANAVPSAHPSLRNLASEAAELEAGLEVLAQQVEQLAEHFLNQSAAQDFRRQFHNLLPREGRGDCPSDWVDHSTQSEPAVVSVAAVVQANDVLWEADNDAMAPAVVVFAADEGHRHRPDFSSDLAAKLSQLRDTDDRLLSADELEVALKLRNPESHFSEYLPRSITGGVPVYWKVEWVDPCDLPGGVLPADGLLVALVRLQGAEAELRWVPPEAWATQDTLEGLDAVDLELDLRLDALEWRPAARA